MSDFMDERIDQHYRAIMDLARERGIAPNELALVCMVIAGGFVGRNCAREAWSEVFAEAEQCMREAAQAQRPVSH